MDVWNEGDGVKEPNTILWKICNISYGEHLKLKMFNVGEIDLF